MKALILSEMGGRLSLENFKLGELAKGYARVRVKAASFNRRDLWIQKGQYAGLKYPIILGSDGSGIVEEVNCDSTIDKDWMGKPVIILPSIGWEEDSEAFPDNFKILGLPDNGTFAEFVDVPIENLYHKPEFLSFQEAAAFPLAGLTAYRALFKKASLKPHHKIFITGIGGGVATMAFKFALALGCEVYMSSSGENKLSEAMAIGGKFAVNYKEDGWEKQLFDKSQGFDVIIDSALGDDFPKLIELASPGGCIVFFGGTNGNIPELNGRRIFWKQLQIKGTTMGSAVDFQNMLNFIQTHQITPIISKVLPMKKAQEGFDILSDSRQFGKIVISMED